jgi:hypothetical protein
MVLDADTHKRRAWYGGVYIMTNPLCIHDDTVEHKGSRGMDQIQI